MAPRLPVALEPRAAVEYPGERRMSKLRVLLGQLAPLRRYVAIPPPDVGIMSRLGLRLALVGLGAELFRVRHADPTHWTRPRLPGQPPPISASTSTPLSLPRSRASATTPAPLSGVGDRTDSYSRLWQDGAKLRSDLPSCVPDHSPAESGLSGGASF